MDATTLKVLLIGNSLGGFSPLLNRLTKRRCNCRSAISNLDVCRLLDNQTFNLVLAPMRLNGSSLYSLIGQLAESGTTLFYSQKVEAGCWWLPPLRRGENCFGAPALRPGEFVFVLAQTIEEIRSSIHMTDENRPVLASSLPDSIRVLLLSLQLSFVGIPVGVKGPSLVASKAAG